MTYLYRSHPPKRSFLDEVVKKYAEKTIQHWYYWQKEPENCLDGDLNAYKNEKKIVEYVRNQLQEDIATDQISLKEYIDPFTGDKNTKA